MGNDLRVTPARTTADTQLLGDPTCRRFLSSLWELEGHSLSVTPTVARELPGNVRASEERRWQRAIRHDVNRGNQRYDPAAYNAILQATREAAEAWIKEELDKPAGLVAVQRTVDTDEKAAVLARTIPALCFRSTNEDNEWNDRAIVAEAVVHGFRLQASQNLRSIARDRLNHWLQERNHTDGPLIVNVEEAIPARSRNPGDLETAALRAVMGAALPVTDRGADHDVRALTRFIDVLKIGHAKQCGWWAEDALRASRDIPSVIRAARDNLPMQTRDADARRLRATREAAEGAGYQGGYRATRRGVTATGQHAGGTSEPQPTVQPQRPGGRGTGG